MGGSGTAALLLALVGVAGGLAVPRLIAWIPEPERTDHDPAKEPYAAIAALPGLAGRAGLVGAGCGAIAGLAVGWDWALMLLAVLLPIGIALALIDWRTRLLPTRIIAPAYGVVLVLVAIGGLVTGSTDDVIRAGWGWLIAGGLFLLLWLIHPRGMGYGDVRLSGVLGIALGYLGWGPLLVGVYAGFLLGGLGGALLWLARRVQDRSFPFGPFMLAGALLGVVLGERLLSWLVR